MAPKLSGFIFVTFPFRSCMPPFYNDNVLIHVNFGVQLLYGSLSGGNEISVGLTMCIFLQIDDLYSEVLYALVRGRGPQSEADGLICHLQQVFHIDNDKHTKLLQAAREKKVRKSRIRVEFEGHVSTGKITALIGSTRSPEFGGGGSQGSEREGRQWTQRSILHIIRVSETKAQHIHETRDLKSCLERVLFFVS